MKMILLYVGLHGDDVNSSSHVYAI